MDDYRFFIQYRHQLGGRVLTPEELLEPTVSLPLLLGRPVTLMYAKGHGCLADARKMTVREFQEAFGNVSYEDIKYFIGWNGMDAYFGREIVSQYTPGDAKCQERYTIQYEVGDIIVPKGKGTPAVYLGEFEKFLVSERGIPSHNHIGHFYCGKENAADMDGIARLIIENELVMPHCFAKGKRPALVGSIRRGGLSLDPFSGSVEGRIDWTVDGQQVSIEYRRA